MSVHARLRILPAVAFTLAASLMQGCFTGVESTPRITAKDIRKQKASETAEQQFLLDVNPERPLLWRPGKEFFVADNRIALIFTPDAADADSLPKLAGKTLTLKSVGKARGITGEEEMEFTFTASGVSRPLAYRPGITSRQFDTIPRLDIPFAVDKDLVSEVAARMKGNTYYILTPRRLDSAGIQTSGLRYIPVRITDVTPGDANYPIRVAFTEAADTSRQYSLLMTVGTGRTSTRNFHTLFAFTDPRLRYPQITDDVWALIQRSQIRQGMTPDECRLALGAPNEYLRIPTTGGMAERWSYDNGVYLFFEDGMLTRFRR